MYIKKASIQGMSAPSASSAIRQVRIRLSQVAMVHMEHKNCKIQMHSHLKSLLYDVKFMPAWCTWPQEKNEERNELDIIA